MWLFYGPVPLYNAATDPNAEEAVMARARRRFDDEYEDDDDEYEDERPRRGLPRAATPGVATPP